MLKAKSFIIFVCILVTAKVFPQIPWQATLTINPFPSPYISDWQTNPSSLGSLSIFKDSRTPTQITLQISITLGGLGEVFQGTSSPIAIPAVTNYFIDNTKIMRIANPSFPNSDLKTKSIQSGRLPEGEYMICINVLDQNGGILAANVCGNFTIVYPEPPHLVFPMNRDSLETTNKYPVFQWTPVFVPPAYQIKYFLKIAEVLLGQTPEQALAANVPQYENKNLTAPTFVYPIDALPLEPGKIYAWQVQAIDQNGLPPTQNNGKSEIWTFSMRRNSVLVPPPIKITPPSHHTVNIFSTSTVKGQLNGTFTPPSTGITFHSNGSSNESWALANITVKLVVKYVLIQPGFHFKAGAEREVPRYKLPSDPRFDDADQVAAVTTTDAQGNFSFSFLNADSAGLIQKNMTIDFEGGEFHDYFTGDLNRVFKIIVESPYYCSPNDDIICQPWQTDDVGTLSALARSYQLKVTVLPGSYQAANQITQGPLSGINVFILRQNRPQDVPDNEGSPSPPSPESFFGIKIIAVATSDQNGVVTFSNLFKNIGPNDTYYIYAASDPKSDKNYFSLTVPFQFDYQFHFDQQLNYQLSPQAAYNGDNAVYNQDYLIPTVSYTQTMMPLQPRVAGTVYRSDNPNEPVWGANVQLMKYALLFWDQEQAMYSLSDGSFSFNNLPLSYDANGNLIGPIRGLQISKYGFKDYTAAVNNGNPLKLGQQAYFDKILLDPAAKVHGEVADENGNPVKAKVTLGDGATVDANWYYSFRNYKFQNTASTFTTPAILGNQQIIIDPTPYDQSYFPDTEYVNVTQDGQDLGTFIVKKKLHRIRIIVTSGTRPEIEHGKKILVPFMLQSAQVEIENVGKLYTDNYGTAETTFVNSNQNYKIVVSGPSGGDFVPRVITLNNPETKYWTDINVDLQKATHVSGFVYAGETPIPGAHVYLDQQQSPDLPPVETYTDNSGHYILHNIPPQRNAVFDAAKSSSNYIGDSKTISKLTLMGKDSVNFNLKVYGNMDLTKLLNIPIEVTKLDSSSQGVSISGNLIHLPSNNVFQIADTSLAISFNKVLIVPGNQKNSNGIPFAEPKSSSVQTDINSLELKLYDKLIAYQEDKTNGIQVSDDGNGNGIIQDKTYISAVSFSGDPAFSNIEFPNDRLYLNIKGESGSQKLIIPVITAGGNQITSNGFNLSDNSGNSLDYTLYGFNAVADSSQSYVLGDTVILATVIHSNIQNVTPADINLSIGDVILHSSKFEAINSTKQISIPLEKWKLQSGNWSINQQGGFSINQGILVTGTVDIPFSGLQITPTELKYGAFQTASMNLAGIIPLIVTGKAYFGYDQGKGHWSVSIAPQQNSSYSAYIANLPGLNSNDQVRINNFYLLSNGDNGYTIDGNSPALTVYKVGKFNPTMFNVYSNDVHIPGTMDLQMPSVGAQSCAIDFENQNGQPAFKLQTFPFSFSVNGVDYKFPANQQYSETFDNSGFKARGTVSESGKFSFNVDLYRTADSTSIWIEPNQQLNISQSGSTKLLNIAGAMHVQNNAWDHLWFAGDLTGANGASGRLTFTVYGDIVASNQQLGVKNISTPFGDLSVTYDFANHVLEGTLHIDKDISGGAHVKGDANSIVDEDGWYFVAGAELKLSNPHMDGNAAIVFGDHPMTDNIKQTVEKYSWIYQNQGNLPSSFPSTVSGFYFEGEVSLPIPIIPSFDFNFGLVSAKLWTNVGGDVRLAMLFSGDGNTYDAGIDVFADVGAGIGASIGIACGGMSAEVLADVGLEGQYQTNGNWYVDGDASLTLKGSTYAGWGICDSNCGGSLCNKSTESASIAIGIKGHYGTDTKYIQVYFK